jgi:hypothetical protein
MTVSSAKTRKLTPLLLMTSVCMLSACTSSTGTDAASAMGSKGKAKGVGNGGGGSSSTTGGTTTTPTPTPTPVSTGTATYDTSIGNGVDANGFADLPLRQGDKRIYVNALPGYGGSDSNNCLSPSTPCATFAKAITLRTDGHGDQILVAEGSSLPETLIDPRHSLNFMTGGYSLAYPFVIESYDPTDPANEAKMGRASGSKRPMFTGSWSGNWFQGGTHQSYIAVRGLDLNPGNVSGQGIGMVNTGDGFLFENNIFRYTGIGIGGTAGTTQHHWIFRNNAIYGEWEAVNATGGQGLYVDGTDSLTVEDNVFYHNGWKIGASRTDTLANGGATQFRHPIYQQVPTDAVVRRNLIVDGSADGGSFRGDITHYENVVIDCPQGASLGGGMEYNTGRPNGVAISSHDNAIIGSAQVPDSGAAGWGIVSQNGKLGSSAYNNLIVRSGVGSSAFLTSAIEPQPSYMDYSNNVVYQWSTPGSTHYDGVADPYTGMTHTTYNNNIWDDATSGTNTNNSSRTFPNPYTAAQLYAALGFADKQAFIDYAITHPEAHIQRNARVLLFAGYGMH